jgi:hypothetical protein
LVAYRTAWDDGLCSLILFVFIMLSTLEAHAYVVRGYSEVFSMATATASPVENDPNAPPSVTRLTAIFPNPFNPRTTIAFDLAQAGMIEVAIFDVRGVRVRVLETGNKPVGRYVATWDGQDDRGRDAATGTYLCRLMTAQGSQTWKMVLAR